MTVPESYISSRDITSTLSIMLLCVGIVPSLSLLPRNNYTKPCMHIPSYNLRFACRNKGGLVMFSAPQVHLEFLE